MVRIIYLGIFTFLLYLISLWDFEFQVVSMSRTQLIFETMVVQKSIGVLSSHKKIIHIIIELLKTSRFELSHVHRAL